MAQDEVDTNLFSNMVCILLISFASSIIIVLVEGRNAPSARWRQKKTTERHTWYHIHMPLWDWKLATAQQEWAWYQEFFYRSTHLSLEIPRKVVARLWPVSVSLFRFFFNLAFLDLSRTSIVVALRSMRSTGRHSATNQIVNITRRMSRLGYFNRIFS